MSKKRVHIVPHMHWDREWYFTTEESRILLINNMEEILERLETDPNYPHYILDGQTCILEDYFAIKPQNKERVKNLVQSGKLIIGPWYSQTDSIVVNGESIIRNLFYGIKDCKEFGEHMKIGYLPDSFGQSEQLPQIFRGFDIDKSMFWRGCSERQGTDKTEFMWKSNDGSEVLAQILPLGYAIGKYLPNDVDALQKRLTAYIEVLDRGATTNVLILPNGHDQMPLQKDIHNVIDTLHKAFPDCEFFLSSYDKVYDEILSNNPQLDVIQGEFIDGKYMRVHRSISSTRMDIKVLNTEIENKITNILEPLMTIAHSLGFEYHHGLVEHIWKLIMKNHAHDSIGCCCSDEVHREIKERFLLAEDKVDKLIEFIKRKIVDHNKDFDGKDKIALFNLLPHPKKELHETTIRIRANDIAIHDEKGNAIDFKVVDKQELDPGLIDRQIVHYGVYNPFMEYTIQFEAELPSMGYRIFYIEGKDTNAVVDTPEVLDCIENDFYKITANPNGTVNIFNKKLNKEFKNILAIENSGDDGDEYDYSPPKDDWVITSHNAKAITEFYKKGDILHCTINHTLNLPQNLQERASKQASVSMPVSICITLKEQFINVRTQFDNKAEDHRLRLLIPTDLVVNESIADQQFGLITRPLHDSALDIWEQESWSEKPVNIYSMMNFVGLCDGKEGISCLTNGIREYEIIDQNTIAITLMRGIGTLGKAELLYRPGRPSGIALPTPDSQMKGEQYYDIGIYWYEGNAISSFDVARSYTTPVVDYNKIPFNAMKLNLEDKTTPSHYQLVTIEGEGQLSVLKVSENNEGMIVRIFNPNRDVNIDTSLLFNKKITKAYLTNLNEDIQSEVAVNDNKILLSDIKPNQVITILAI